MILEFAKLAMKVIWCFETPRGLLLQRTVWRRVGKRLEAENTALVCRNSLPGTWEL